MSKFKAAKKTFDYFFGRLLRGFIKDQNRQPNNLEMILIKQEARKNLIDQNKVIDVQFGKPFSEEVNKMIKSGDVKIGKAPKTPPYQKSQADIEFEIIEKIKADNKKAIKGFESRNPKPKTTDVDKAIDNASPGFANDRKYDAQLVADDLAEKRFGKEFYDLDEIDQMELYDEAYQGLSKQRFKQQQEAKPISEPTKKFTLNKERFKKDFNVTDEEIEKISLLSPEDQQKKVREYIDKDFKEQIELADYDVTDLKPNAEGGIVGYYTGGMVDVEPNLSDIGHGSDSLMARTRLVAPDGQATTSTGLNYLLAEDNDNIRVPFENGGDFKQFQKEKMMQLMQEYQQYLKNREIEKRQRPYMEKRMGTGPGPILEAAEGGRIGFAGGTTEEKLKEMKNARTRAAIRLAETMGIGNAIKIVDSGDFNFETGNYEGNNEELLRLFNMKFKGGRIGFSKGKLADAARRKFMKTAGAGAAGLAALKTGLIGLGEKAAPVVEKAVETVQGTPQYFFDLVAKIKMFGKQSKFGPQERVNEFSYTGKNGDEYVLTEDIVTGDAQITKDKMGAVRVSEDEMTDGIKDRSIMEYKSGKGIADESSGGALADEYDEYRVEFDMDGTMSGADNIDESVQKEIIEEASEKITKKASGGIAKLLGE